MVDRHWIWSLVLFFKQKTAYEMSISDWSSDVCSSDLATVIRANAGTPKAIPGQLACGKRSVWIGSFGRPHPISKAAMAARGRICQYTQRQSNRPSVHCPARSEEHTSELQSLMRISSAVFCMKNKKHKTLSTYRQLHLITHSTLE